MPRKSSLENTYFRSCDYFAIIASSSDYYALVSKYAITGLQGALSKEMQKIKDLSSNAQLLSKPQTW